MTRRDSGLTLIELLFVVALVSTLIAIALPLTADALDRQRCASAARYLAGRVYLARMEAVKRSTNVGIKFDAVDADYKFTTYVDGNGNGIRTLDIRLGIDVSLTSEERLSYTFAGVRFGLMPGVPDVDGDAHSAGGDGVRIGAARILTLGSNGTATAGTLYVHSRKEQFAVRIFGVTGRTRVLHYHTGERRWVSR